ncbi:hypothetical protein NIES4071_16900 [Calothrix sp. NIES-4071]|nr:hypothetical protein NIES4071_16900 [Calothrix sp. NIES-4071]BAZ56023.1 hypothetical protein NIES4105_16850 [Calothrix sp. NIES-4105]
MSKRTQLLEAIAALPEELVDQALSYVHMLLSSDSNYTGSLRGAGTNSLGRGFQYGLWWHITNRAPRTRN